MKALCCQRATSLLCCLSFSSNKIKGFPYFATAEYYVARFSFSIQIMHSLSTRLALTFMFISVNTGMAFQSSDILHSKSSFSRSKSDTFICVRSTDHTLKAIDEEEGNRLGSLPGTKMDKLRNEDETKIAAALENIRERTTAAVDVGDMQGSNTMMPSSISDADKNTVSPSTQPRPIVGGKVDKTQLSPWENKQLVSDEMFSSSMIIAHPFF